MELLYLMDEISPDRAFEKWLEHCLGGDIFLMPPSWQSRMHDIRELADRKIRFRNPKFRIWLQSDPLAFACKVWIWDSEPPPYRKWRKKKKK
jgi:hypothetical protein